MEMECFNCGNSDCKCSITFQRECYVCNEWFYTMRSLKTHLQSHPETRLHQCDICEETFTGKEYLNLHKKLHAGNKLLITSIATSCAVNNSAEFYNAKPAKRKRKFKCDICDRKFFIEYHLLLHKHKHQNDVEKRNHRLLVDRNDVEKYTCIICDRSYNDPDKLKIHIASHSYSSISACNICEKTFTGKSYLKLHMRIHMPPKKYNCVKCGATFLSGRILSLHIKKHHKPRDFKCELCDRGFRSKLGLTKHQCTHLDNEGASEQKIQCNYCKKHIKTSNMRLHCDRNHGDNKNLDVVKRPHHCDICGKSFILKLNLNLHLKMQHSIQVSNQDESY